MNQSAPRTYGLSEIAESHAAQLPQLDYLPQLPEGQQPPIALIGAGGISEYHLRAYRALNLNVVVICDLDASRAADRQRAYYPDADVETDFRRVLMRDDVAVVDVATHPQERLQILPAALEAGKHVLSQKPFVTDLQDGRRLVELADHKQVKLAVNQNGRWAPHFSYLRQAVAAGLLGPVSSIDYCLQWDHTWTASTPFNEIHHLILYDFGIHWFDLTAELMGDTPPDRIFSSVRRTSYQAVKPPFLAHVAIDYPHAQVRMSFNAHTSWGQADRTIAVGRDGTFHAYGPGFNDQRVDLWTEFGHVTPTLQGTWFENGFQGAMGELLMAIHEDREPVHSARNNLRSLQLCFAAVASADRCEAVIPSQIERLSG
jgi:predicted dehydrogenase